MKVCMLVRTTYDHDARVRREATALRDAGHEVVVLALPTSTEDERHRVVEDGITVARVRSTPLPLWQAAWERVGPWLVGGAPAAPPSPDDDVAPASGAASSVGPPAATARVVARLRLLLGALLITLRELRRDRAYRRAAVAERADAYHAHDADTLGAARRAAVACGAHLVYDAHELVVGETEGRSWRSRVRLGLVERRHVPHADAVITVCQSIADAIGERHGIPTPVVLRNIPPSADAAGPADELDADLRRLAGLDRDATVALFLGMASIERGVGTMLEALATLPGMHLVVLGPQFDGALARVRDAAARAGVLDRLHVLAPVRPEQVVPTARAADVGLVLPHDVSLNHRFSLPNKLFEYVGAGLPVVASDLPELRRIVVGHGLGEVCDPTDAAAVADAIRAVTSDPRHAAAARAARVELCWEREQQRLVEVYEGLGGPGRERPGGDA